MKKKNNVLRVALATTLLTLGLSSCVVNNDQKLENGVKKKERVMIEQNNQKFNKFKENNLKAIMYPIKDIFVPVKLVLNKGNKNETVVAKLSIVDIKDLVEGASKDKFYKINGEYYNASYIINIKIDDEVEEKAKDLFETNDALLSEIQFKGFNEKNISNDNLEELKKLVDKKEKLISELSEFDNSNPFAYVEKLKPLK